MAGSDVTKPQLKSLTLPSLVNVGSGGASVSFSAIASDDDSGVAYVTLNLDKGYRNSNGQYFAIGISGSGPADNWTGSAVEAFGAGTESGTYNVRSASVTDRAGNVASYSADELKRMGLSTSFAVSSVASTDKTPPVLTSLSLPQVVDISKGDARITVSVGATDTGSGVDRVSVNLSAPFSNFGIPTSNFLVQDGSGSFSDGLSSTTVTISADTKASTYAISSIQVTDKAGNIAFYSSDQLVAMGLASSLTVVNHSLPATVAVTAPLSVREGDGSIALSLTSLGGIAGTINVSVQAGTNSGRTTDLAGPFYDTTYISARDTQIDLPRPTIIDDLVYEPDKLVPVYIKAAGQLFDNGTDSTVVWVKLIDNDQLGTGGNDTLLGDAGQNYLGGLSGNDLLMGFGGTDLLDGGDGDDVLIGGMGTDTLTGGAGFDIFKGTRAELDGDRITDFTVGDRINFSDATLADFVFTRSGSMLSLGSAALLDLGSFSGRLLALTSSDKGVDLFALRTSAGDFTGDGRSDLVFRNVNGAVSTWNVSGDGRQVQQSAFNASADTSWKIAETFDMNGDGRTDIVWRNANGAVAAWASNGPGFDQASYYHAPISTAWRIAGAGDLNADGKDDLLWQNDNGSISAWTSTGSGFQESTYNHGSPGGGWLVEGLGDFNGDGRADILWRNTDGSVAMWTNNGAGTSFNEGAFYQPRLSTAWHIDGVGDFNGDGRDDILWRNDDGSVSVWRGNGSAFDQSVYNTKVSNDWHIAQVGDLNGDGRADIVWRNDNGAVSTWHSNGGSFDQSIYNSTASTDWSIAGHDFVL